MHSSPLFKPPLTHTTKSSNHSWTLISFSPTTMGEYYYYNKKSQIPAFGSWDWNDNLPFTQCFESAREAGFLRYSYSDSDQNEERDLYVTGDLYENHLVTPAMIVVPRTKAKVREQHEKGTKKKKNRVSDVEAPTSPVSRPTPKPVDEDLYKISPAMLYAKANKKKRGLCFFSSCLLPTCIA